MCKRNLQTAPNSFVVFVKFSCWYLLSVKGLARLALTDLHELQETAHVKNYIAVYFVEVSILQQNTQNIISNKNSGSSLLIKCCLEKSWGGPKANLISPLCLQYYNFGHTKICRCCALLLLHYMFQTRTPQVDDFR